MAIDRSFHGFKQLLLRIINGPDAPKPAAKPVRSAPRRPGADQPDGWSRLEL